MEKGRIKIWINREIQLRFVLYVLLFLVISSMLVSFVTFYSVWSQLIKTITVSELKDISAIYHDTIRYFTIRIVGLTLFLALLGCLGILLISHKVAGPAYRITAILKTLQEGKEPVFTLRKNDTLGSIMEELKMFAGMHLRLVKASNRVLDIWKKTQVQDMSLNLALKDLEESFQPGAAREEVVKP